MTYDLTLVDVMSNFSLDEIASYLEDNGMIYRNSNAHASDHDDDDELISVLEMRGYTVLYSGTDFDRAIERVVQMHRTGDPRWESHAASLLYSLGNKVV